MAQQKSEMIYLYMNNTNDKYFIDTMILYQNITIDGRMIWIQWAYRVKE